MRSDTSSPANGGLCAIAGEHRLRLLAAGVAI